jgi:hypothetical protein
LTVAGAAGVLGGVALLVVGATTALACDTSTTTSLHEASISAGSTDFDTATVDTYTKGASGSVTFTVYTDDKCKDPATVGSANEISAQPGSVALVSSSTSKVATATSPSVTFYQPAPAPDHIYYWQAVYSGDNSNDASSSACGSENLTVIEPTTTTTTVYSNLVAVNGPLVVGAVVTDVAKVGPAFDQTPIGGSVSFTFFTNGSCSSPGTKAGTLPVLAGAAISLPEGPLGVGSYSFQATYNGDDNYAGSTGVCEPFTVGPDIITTVHESGGGVWTNSEATGSKAYDAATVEPKGEEVTPSGTVTYTLFDNGTCTPGEDNANVLWTQNVTLKTDGSVPNSNLTAPLTAGSYSFQASYSSTSRWYPSSTGACEPFSVGKAATVVTTAVMDAANGAAWAGSEATGSSAYDTATVRPEQDDTVITGTVTYSFFTNGSCASNGDSAPITDTVTMSGGTVPNSSTEGPLGAGSYSFLASYSGDSNYAPAIGGCEPLTVGKAATTVTSVVTDAASGGVWKNSELAGASAYDTAAVAPEQDDTPITGTVSYQFFSDGTCTGTSVSAGSAPVSDGVAAKSDTEGPLAAGSYSFLVSYSGDANYAASIGSCEPLTVQSTPTPTPTSTPTSTPTVSPTGGVLGASTPGTGAGPSDGLTWLGLLLLTLGGAVLAVTGLIRRTKGAIENI